MPWQSWELVCTKCIYGMTMWNSQRCKAPTYEASIFSKAILPIEGWNELQLTHHGEMMTSDSLEAQCA
jgi:hypothetical protein